MPIIDFNDLNTQVFLVPFVASILTIGGLRMIFGVWRGSLLSSFGIGGGYLLAYFLIRKIEFWPVRDHLSMLPLIIMAGLVIGTLIDNFNMSSSIKNPVFIAFPLGIVFLLSGINQGEILETESLIFFGIMMLIGFWAIQRLENERDEGLAPAITSFSALGGLGIIGFLTNSEFGYHASAMAMALLGFIAWNWPRCRYPWGTAHTIMTGTGVVTLSLLMIQSNPTLIFPVAFIYFSFIMYEISSKVFPSSPKAQPFIQLLISGIPVAISGFLVFYGL